MLTKTEELLDFIVENKKQMQDKCKIKFLEIFEEFFSTNPDVKTIYFTAFTPYWQDGDECVFGLGHEIGFTGADFAEIDTDIWHEENPERAKETNTIVFATWGNNKNADLPESVKSIGELLSNDDFLPHLEDIVGDHVFVRIHRGGIETTEYDHE
jgi:hypothetical protein